MKVYFIVVIIISWVLLARDNDEGKTFIKIISSVLTSLLWPGVLVYGLIDGVTQLMKGEN